MSREAESMNFNVSTGGEEKNRNKDCRILTLKKVFDFIDKKDYDESVKKELKRMVSGYPQNAFESFGKNFSKHLASAHKAARKNRPMFIGELGEDSYKRLESIDGEFKAPDKNKNSVVSSLPKKPTVDFDDLEFLKMEEAAIEDAQEASEADQAVASEAVASEAVVSEAVVNPEEAETPYGLKEINDSEPGSNSTNSH